MSLLRGVTVSRPDPQAFLFLGVIITAIFLFFLIILGVLGCGAPKKCYHYPLCRGEVCDPWGNIVDKTTTQDEVDAIFEAEDEIWENAPRGIITPGAITETDFSSPLTPSEAEIEDIKRSGGKSGDQYEPTPGPAPAETDFSRVIHDPWGLYLDSGKTDLEDRMNLRYMGAGYYCVETATDSAIFWERNGWLNWRKTDERERTLEKSSERIVCEDPVPARL